jgi:hypothetical protein
MFTASAGLIFSYLLYVSGLIPRFLAQLGLVGYITLDHRHPSDPDEHDPAR